MLEMVVEEVRDDGFSEIMRRGAPTYLLIGEHAVALTTTIDWI